jgi:hypothetical protein
MSKMQIPRNSEKELGARVKPYGTMECWNIGCPKRRKCSFWFRSASLEDRFAEARGKGFLAFSLKSAAGGRSSNFFQGRTARSDFSGDLRSFQKRPSKGPRVFTKESVDWAKKTLDSVDGGDRVEGGCGT